MKREESAWHDNSPIVNREIPIHYWEESFVGGFLSSYFCIKEILKHTIMKTRRQVLIWMVALLSIALPVSAIGLGDIRVNARFLTDRMAFELGLGSRQQDDLYEVNYDFLRNIDPYLDGIAYQDEYALDCYYRFLDERNDDLRWILSSSEYARFMVLDYFFRPIYAHNGYCRLRVYQRYSDRNFFYFPLPMHYMTYDGGHGRAFWHGNSYYERNFAGRYNHPVYRREVPSRPGRMNNGFAPNRRPMNNGSGFHFEPMQQPRQGMNNNRQWMDNNRQRKDNNRQGMDINRQRMDNNWQGMNNDRRPGMMDNNRQRMDNNNRPNMNNGRQNNEGFRQQQNQSRPDNNFRQEKRNDRQSTTQPNFNRQQSNRTENQRSEQRQNRNDNSSMNNERRENRQQMQSRRESPQQNRPSSTRENSRGQSSSSNSRFSRGL